MNINSHNHQLKVSIVVSDLSASGSGRWGGAVRPFLLAQALKKLGYEVEILGLAFESGTPPFYAPNISIVYIPCQYYSGIVSAAKELLQKIDGDIIYVVKLKTTSFGLSVLKKLISGRPLILDIDDWELSWYGGDDWKYRPSLKQLARDIFKQDGALRYADHPLYLKWMEGLRNYADIITTHTHFLQQRFGGIYLPQSKDVSLFNPEQYTSEESKAKYGLAGYKVLMFPGAPRPYKGVEDVLNALEILQQPDLKLVIVGGSPYDEYDNFLREKWGKWIIQLPKYPVNVMPEIVAAADIIVVPQRDTPATLAQFPLKLTDGMAMAKPIIATRVGDIPEILADTGFLVDPRTPEQIAATIQHIFNNWEFAHTQGVKARQRCIDNYSLDKMASVLEKVIGLFTK